MRQLNPRPSLDRDGAKLLDELLTNEWDGTEEELICALIQLVARKSRGLPDPARALDESVEYLERIVV